MSGARKAPTGWSRRNVLSVGAGIGASAGVAGITGCSSGSSDSKDPGGQSLDNPGDNVNKKGLPIVDKPVALHFMTAKHADNAKDYNKVASWAKYQKMTKVKVDWGLVPDEGMEEKRNLALSSGDYPEVFYGGGFNTLDLVKYGQQGVFIDLAPLIDEYMPNLKKLVGKYDDVKRGMTFPDGKIYGMPRIFDPKFLALQIKDKPWVRADWLDKFDMEQPTTVAEYRKYLEAVKTKQPNGKSAAIGYADPYQGSQLRNALMGSFGVGNRGVKQSYLDAEPDDDTKVRFFPVADGYRALLEYMHQPYSDGLILKNIFSVDQAKVNEAAAKGEYGSMVDMAPGSHYGGKAKNFVPIRALKGPDGEHTYNNVGSPLADIGNFVITKKNDHPVVTARWMDYFYSDEGTKLFFMGVEGKSYQETKHGVEYLDKITNNPKGLTQNEALKPYVTYVGGGYPGLVKQDYFKGTESSKESTEAAELLKPDAQKTIWASFTFTQNESEKLNSLADDIEKYVDESRDKFITGDLAMSKWKSYVNKIKKMGLDDYLEIQQDAYDRYRKA